MSFGAIIKTVENEKFKFRKFAIFAHNIVMQLHSLWMCMCVCVVCAG